MCDKKNARKCFCASNTDSAPCRYERQQGRGGGERGPGESILYVDDDGGSTYTSIQDAVDDAGPHTTIVVNPGSYGSVEIRDKSDLTIEGNGSSYEDVIIAAGFSTNPSFAISRSTNITVTGVTVSLSLSSYAFYVSRSDNVSI
ncbi:MAG: hypothetical protein DRN40_06355, partial [Thermoplasmata archaeon]